MSKKVLKIVILFFLLLQTLVIVGCDRSEIYEVADTITEEAEKLIDEAAEKYKESSGGTESESIAEDSEKSEEESAKEDAAKAYRLAVTQTSADRYAYSTLDIETAAVYDEVLYAMENYIDTIEVSTTDLDVLDRAFDAVLADYGEIFWVSGYTYRTYYQSNQPKVYTRVDFSPTYTMTEGEKDSYMDDVESKAEGYLSEAALYSTDYEKVLYLFERLISDVDYVQDAPENQNIISVFLYGQTVCSGYANAMQYLCNRLGITCAVVKGTANGDSHAWNLVQMDGAYYYVDVTWGNSAYSTGEDASQHYYINYAYFGLTTAEIIKTHADDGTFSLPDCFATADNYYVKNGLYFTEFQADAVGSIFRNAYNSGASHSSVKFATKEQMETALDYFITQGRIVDYCPGISSVKYFTNDNLYVLELEF